MQVCQNQLTERNAISSLSQPEFSQQTTTKMIKFNVLKMLTFGDNFTKIRFVHSVYSLKKEQFITVNWCFLKGQCHVKNATLSIRVVPLKFMVKKGLQTGFNLFQSSVTMPQFFYYWLFSFCKNLFTDCTDFALPRIPIGTQIGNI